MIDVKIEDINYTLPTAQISEKDFDKVKWLENNPIDYFKLIYVLFNTTNNSPKDIPREIAMDIAFQAMYPVIRLYIPDILYKFCSFTNDEKLNEKKLLTLKNKQIFMSDIKDFNDPFDGKAFFYNPNELKEIKRLAAYNGRFIDDFTSYLKGTALTENDANCMPMWAHYSNNHQGFCVSYDMKNSDNQVMSSCTFPIQYTNQRLDITSFMKEYAKMVSAEVDKQLSQGKRQIQISDLSIIYLSQYLTNIKHSTWQYEKEYRCSMGAVSKGMPYINATPKAIYIGMNCNEKYRKDLIDIAKELSVSVYQMEFNELSECYTLEAKLL